MLEKLGMTVIRHPFGDHHQYIAPDFEFDRTFPLVMTEKDAVKCRTECSRMGLDEDASWYVPVNCKMSGDLASRVIEKLKTEGWLNG
jgi:tetraacyldisaccharide 4'-kinase